MKQTESAISKKERNSYWEGNPTAWKKWLGRVLLALLALYYGWGLTLIVEARSVPALFVIVFAVLPIIWPFWLCFLVELGMSWLPVVIASLAVLVWASIQVVRAKRESYFSFRLRRFSLCFWERLPDASFMEMEWHHGAHRTQFHGLYLLDSKTNALSNCSFSGFGANILEEEFE